MSNDTRQQYNVAALDREPDDDQPDAHGHTIVGDGPLPEREVSGR